MTKVVNLFMEKNSPDSLKSTQEGPGVESVPPVRGKGLRTLWLSGICTNWS